ncbi:histidine protein methyltransferase 1 homolog isoform X2 [Orussus abietinus]|uniref:histidine protein methyltransferase 1 homolog isoform X2 n=1 Tax=Orussus abietinus TaxID=222816 RepID=UPI0006254CD1|nr:histidine protein methyltransferase 1 homolog isoform X2 [Orussus abietinus]
MFKFNFSRDEIKEDKNVEQGTEASLAWLLAAKVQVPLESFNKIRENYGSDCDTTVFGDCQLKLVPSEKIVEELKSKECTCILQAEARHSDLLPAEYEGGLKIWECTHDLGNYLLQEGLPLKNKVVLDLGCGAGVIGLFALSKGSRVHFQDYNKEVLESLTIPNVFLNASSAKTVAESCEFYSGDWESLNSLLSKRDEKTEEKIYDFIFTSETIYNPDSHEKLYNVFKRRLKSTGTGNHHQLRGRQNVLLRSGRRNEAIREPRQERRCIPPRSRMEEHGRPDARDTKADEKKLSIDSLCNPLRSYLNRNPKYYSKYINS